MSGRLRGHRSTAPWILLLSFQRLMDMWLLIYIHDIEMRDAGWATGAGGIGENWATSHLKTRRSHYAMQADRYVLVIQCGPGDGTGSPNRYRRCRCRDSAIRSMYVSDSGGGRWMASSRRWLVDWPVLPLSALVTLCAGRSCVRPASDDAGCRCGRQASGGGGGGGGIRSRL